MNPGGRWYLMSALPSPEVKRWRLGDSVPAELHGALSLPELSPVSLALSHSPLLPVSLPPFLSLSLGLLLDLALTLSRLSSHISVSLHKTFIYFENLSLSLFPPSPGSF